MANDEMIIWWVVDEWDPRIYWIKSWTRRRWWVQDRCAEMNIYVIDKSSQEEERVWWREKESKDVVTNKKKNDNQ